MSHSVTVRLIADQEIEVNGKTINIHDIRTIYVNSQGQITMVSLDKYSETGELLENEYRLVGEYQ